MRRISTIVIASMLLFGVAATPALASHRGHHRRSHHRHARVERFGSNASQPGSSASTPSSSTAGTVTSFTNGVLTITLSDNSVVSGMVTDRTEIECTATQTDDDSGDVQTDGGGSGGGDNNTTGDNGGGSNNNGGQGNQGGQRDQGDQGDQGDGQSACTTAALTSGTVVQEAELSISSTGKTWGRVDLVTQ
jgi:hypothetical protein